MHHRIEISAFRPGEYVGYCDGAWRISKAGNLWQASKIDSKAYFRASTLQGIGEGLDQRANIAVGKMLFAGA
jgi:hypothetical protein